MSIINYFPLFVFSFTRMNQNISSFLGPVSQNICGTDHSFDETVRNYKYYCDGLLVSIIGCLGILGENI